MKSMWNELIACAEPGPESRLQPACLVALHVGEESYLAHNHGADHSETDAPALTVGLAEEDLMMLLEQPATSQLLYLILDGQASV